MIAYLAIGVGVYRSTDFGLTWSPASAGLPPGRVDSLVMDPAVPSTIFAGTSTRGVYKTTTSGQ